MTNYKNRFLRDALCNAQWLLNDLMTVNVLLIAIGPINFMEIGIPLLGEFIAHYERCHTFIKARDWALEHIKDNRFGKTSYDRGEKNKVQRLMENVDRLREEETLKYVIENRSMITELLESLKSEEEEKKRPNLPNP